MEDKLEKLTVENLTLLNKVKSDYSYDFQPEYNRFINRTTRIEYSKGGILNIYGFYPFEHYSELASSNYSKGKLYKNEIRNYDYKYFFENQKLIMIEKLFDGAVAHTFLIYSEDKKLFLMDYIRQVSKPETKILNSISVCLYNETDMLIKYIYGTLFGTQKFVTFECQEYTYTQSQVKINRSRYADGWLGTKQFREEVYPIELLNKGSLSHKKHPTDDEIKRMLKDNWISIMKSWKIDNGYAISLIMRDRMTIEIDYAEEKPGYSFTKLSEKWDYTNWKQNSTPVLRTHEEEKTFLAWLDNLNLLGISTDYLIENKIFINIIENIIEELKEEGVIKNVFGYPVPIICTDFDIGYEIIELNRKINDDDLITGYLCWVESL